MTTLTVTTAADTTNASDGVLSLREALAAAQTSTQAVNIVFDPAAFVQRVGFPTSIVLEERLEIGGTSQIVVDGSLAGSIYNVRIEPGPEGDRLMTVAGGANVTLRDLVFTGGTSVDPVVGADGANGTSGARGLSGARGAGAGDPGEDGTDGAPAADGSEGALAVGGILNNGALVLERVFFRSIGAVGGDGGFGGSGGAGGRGGNGGTDNPNAVSPVRSDGGDGGDGADGGNGGRGGNAAGAIYNTGALTLRDVGFINMLATGGNGGFGSYGGNGGNGGSWQGSGADLNIPNQGGDGGNGGNGGDGGTGGDAAAAVFSVGSVTIDGPQSTPNGRHNDGLAGRGGDAGNRGGGGWGATFIPRAPADGNDGISGVAGTDGATGDSGFFVGLNPVTQTVFSLSHDGTGAAELPDLLDRTVVFTLNKLGPAAGAVAWRVVAGDGVSAADFEGGVLPGGMIEFGASTSSSSFVVQVANDGLIEGTEQFTVEIYDPRGGVLGWSTSITVTLEDGVPAVVPPTNGNDVRIGTPGDDTVNLLAGNDRYEARAGNDSVIGGPGNDTLIGEAGRDTLMGGDGADVLNGGTEDDFIFGGASSADLRDLIYGGDGADSIDAGYGNDEAYGGAGSDTLEGGFGSDTLFGQDGNDTLSGGALGDLLFGGTGGDFINGGFGADRINGGTGADLFFHLGIADHGSDFIQDYNAAEGDLLVCGVTGAQRSQFQVNLATTAGAGSAGVAEAFVIYRPTGQILWALVDGGDDTQINLRIGGQVFDLLG